MNRPAHRDFPWRTVIRSGMETWMPMRLPAHFQPRRTPGRLGVRSRLRRAWLPVAIAAIALALAMIAHLRP